MEPRDGSRPRCPCGSDRPLPRLRPLTCLALTGTSRSTLILTLHLLPRLRAHRCRRTESHKIRRTGFSPREAGNLAIVNEREAIAVTSGNLLTQDAARIQTRSRQFNGCTFSVMHQGPVGHIDGVEARSGTSPIVIQVRPRSGRTLVRSRRPVADVGPGIPPDAAERIPPLMDRPLRAFQPAALPLEGRLLLARACTATAARRRCLRRRPHRRRRHRRRRRLLRAAGSVWFLGTPSSAGTTQQVVQQGGEATVWLRGYTGGGPLQVQVATDPSSPAVGVNLPAVNQTVTIPGGQSVASVTIPTNAGAPNPGEVDVNLTITPIDPPTGVTVQGGPLELRILAPDATTPPKIIGVAGTPDGIQLMFSKPMNPVQASNVHNYAVRETYTTISGNDDFLSSAPSRFFSPDAPFGGTTTSIFRKVGSSPLGKLRPRRFHGDPHPQRKSELHWITGSIVVTPGSPAKASAGFGMGQAPPKVLLTWRATRSTKAGNRENSGFKCILGMLRSARPQSRKRWASGTLHRLAAGVKKPVGAVFLRSGR